MFLELKKKKWWLPVILGLYGLYSAEVLAQNPRNSQGKGIHFEQGMTWNQVKEKAKSENKYIFVDCYATWCVPCKLMDKQVYPAEIVGSIMNKNFISVKVQMDKTNVDNNDVKAWSQDAADMEVDYKITAFPSFLFFYPDGTPMHKSVGYKDSIQFVELVKDALDTNKQYYRHLADFQPGKIEISKLKELARMFKSSDNDLAGMMAADFLTRIPASEVGHQNNIEFMMEFNDIPEVQEVAINYLKTLQKKDFIAQNNIQLISQFNHVTRVEDLILNYLSCLSKNDLRDKANIDLLRIFKDRSKSNEFARHYLNALKDDDLYSKHNIELLTDFTKTSKDHGFAIFYSYKNRVDSVMGYTGYAKYQVDKIIQKEEIIPYCDSLKDTNKDPDWKQIAINIEKKYNKDYVKRNILNQQCLFYQYKTKRYNTHWSELITSSMEHFDYLSNDTDNYAKLSDVGVNNFCYTVVFFHSTDKKVLKKAIKWMERVLKNSEYKNHGYIDTYANLLYKLGKKAEALKWEEKALKMAQDNKDEILVNLFNNALSKMMKSEPTWIPIPVE